VSYARAAFGQQLKHDVVVDFKPVRIVLNKNGRTGGSELLHMEHFRNETVEELTVVQEDPGTPEVLKADSNEWFEGGSEHAYFVSLEKYEAWR
jgi:hypothetical protein